MANTDTAQDAPERPDAEDTTPEATDAPETGQDDTDRDDSKAGREAAKYRRQLRETEAERDALAARLEALQRAEAERIAGETVSRPAALWAAGIALPELLDDAGNVDPDRVREAVKTAAEKLGLARAQRTPKPDPSQGARGEGPAGNAWESAMRV